MRCRWRGWWKKNKGGKVECMRRGMGKGMVRSGEEGGEFGEGVGC